MKRHLAGFLAAALLPLVVPPAAAREPESRVELLASSAARIEVRVSFDAPEWVEGTEGRHYPSWPDLLPDGEPGTPELPQKIVQVALPPDGPVRIEYRASERGRASGVRFPPAPTWESDRWEGRGPRPDPRPRTVVVEGDAYVQAGIRPRAEILSVGVERGLRVANVAVRPVRYDPVTGDASWAESITLDLIVEAPSRSAVPGSIEERTFPDRVRRTLEGDLVNPREAAGWARLRGANLEGDGLPRTWFGDADGWLKIFISANGVYRLTRSDLAGAGVPVDTIDPRGLRLFAGPLTPDVSWGSLGWTDNGGSVQSTWKHVYERPGLADDIGIGAPGAMQEVAMQVRGEEDGRFDASDLLVFYALGPDNYRDRYGLPDNVGETYLENPYTSETVYWLAWGMDRDTEPLRMAEADAAPRAGSPELTRSAARLHAEENTIYDPAMYWAGYAWEAWFWEFLTTSARAGNRFPIPLPHVVPGSTLDARVRLWGGQRPLEHGVGQEDLHHVNLTVNEADEGLHVWGGGASSSFSPYDVEVTGAPAADPSSFHLTVLQIGDNPDRFDLVYLTWIDIVYRRQLDADGAPAELEIDAGDAGRTVRVADPPSGQARVLDVTDFRHPVLLTGAVSSGGSLAFALDEPGARVVAVTGDGALAKPARLERMVPPAAGWLRDAGRPLDYVIIAYDDFVDEAEVLAAWRRDHLFGITDARPARVRVVSVSEIMNEFAWGMKDPVALRYFLEYAYLEYGQEGDDRLSYCLFFGDHTYDFRDIDGTGTLDYVPSWEDNRESILRLRDGNTQYVTDDPLARFDGLFDVRTDLFIGRVTPKSGSEARGIVEKIVGAERDPDLGPWRMKAILIADDICQGRSTDGIAFGHMRQTENVARLIPDVFDQRKIYLYEYGPDCKYDGKPDAKQDLLSEWSDGAWLVNYIGHGGDVVLADEHVMDLADVPVLANRARYGVFGAFSCSVGKFSKPTQEGLGEALVTAPAAGALVSVAATHLTYTTYNETMNRQFLNELFKDGVTQPVAIGVALMRTKNTQVQSNEKYVCLGDPASRLSVPGLSVDVAGPSSLDRGRDAAYGITVSGGAGRSGLVETVARDASRVVSKNSLGETFFEHAQRLGLSRPVNFDHYDQPGAVLFRGRHEIQDDGAEVEFTVPASLRGGNDGKVRSYAWGEGWDGAGAVLPVTVGGTTPEPDDTEGPVIRFTSESESVFPGESMEVEIEDPSGINLTQLFEFRSIQLKVFDERNVEQIRQDITDRFAYDLGSHTVGRVSFLVPELGAGRYRFTVSAFDNLNNRGAVSLEADLSPAGEGSGLFDVVTYPNPFDPEKEPTRVLFRLERPARVKISIYTVSGRLVRKDEMEGEAGRNAFQWDGRDSVQDAVANGVYLVRLAARPQGGGDEATHLERVVVVR